jgi:hypothetical protein
MAFDKTGLDDYVDVAARIAEFRKKHPEGSLQPVDPLQPFRVETIGDKTFIVVVAAAYRSPDDVRPGIGMAYEPWPGRTPYTKDSELMNAETSAWGRAIVAVLASDTKRIASAEEVRNRQAERERVWDASEQDALRGGFEAEIAAAKDRPEVLKIGERVRSNADLSPATVDRLTRTGIGRLAEIEAAKKAAGGDSHAPDQQQQALPV